LAARQCPNCLAIIPAAKVASYSNSLVCPNCGRPLEISAFCRNLAAFIGLAVGSLVWRLSTAHYADHPNALGWVLPVLFAYLALSVIQPIVLMATADLRLKDLIEAAPIADSHSSHDAHGASAHGSSTTH
jgi:hypothetical protein